MSERDKNSKVHPEVLKHFFPPNAKKRFVYDWENNLKYIEVIEYD